ncbi:unnamed protein product [Calypogeia fissa]
MAHRSAVQRLLARSRYAARNNVSSSLRTEDSSGLHHHVAAQEALRGVIFQQGHDKSEGSTRRKDWEAEFSRQFTERKCCSSGIVRFSRDSDEEDGKGSASIPNIASHPRYRNWENSSAAQNSVSSGISGNFLGHRVRHFAASATTGAAASVFPPVWKGSLYNGRSFSSVPAARADGTQIAVVDRELLDSSQAGGVSDSVGSAVAGFPIPDSESLSEVARAVADCSVPTAFIQYVIDGVHASTGLPWWASIVATTVAIRILVLPVMIYQMKSTARLTLLRPELEKLTNRIKESNYDPKEVEDNQVRMKALFVKHKTTPFSPILGAFIQAPLFMCFFFAIRNMAEKMESFKTGGALWFTDLSTPDSLFIMPVLSGAFFLLTVELGATDGMQGQPMLAKMKMFLRGLAVLLVPLTASFPKALFCYWLTANVFSIFQAAAFRQPGLKAMLGIPDVSHLAKPADIPVTPVVTFSQNPRLKGETRVTSSKRQRS